MVRTCCAESIRAIFSATLPLPRLAMDHPPDIYINCSNVGKRYLRTGLSTERGGISRRMRHGNGVGSRGTSTQARVGKCWIDGRREVNA